MLKNLFKSKQKPAPDPGRFFMKTFVNGEMKEVSYSKKDLLSLIPPNQIGVDFIRRLELLELLPKGSVGVEIGVWEGRFAKNILSTVQPSCLHLVDPWRTGLGLVNSPQDEMDEKFKKVQEDMAGKNVKIWRMPSGDFFKSFTEKVAEKVAEKVDWVYIDGDHQYEGVLQDLNGANLITKEDGMIWGDDFYLNTEAVNMAVRKAVREFCTENKRKYMVIGCQYIIL